MHVHIAQIGESIIIPEAARFQFLSLSGDPLLQEFLVYILKIRQNEMLVAQINDKVTYRYLIKGQCEFASLHESLNVVIRF